MSTNSCVMTSLRIWDKLHYNIFTFHLKLSFKAVRAAGVSALYRQLWRAPKLHYPQSSALALPVRTTNAILL